MKKRITQSELRLTGPLARRDVKEHLLRLAEDLPATGTDPAKLDRLSDQLFRVTWER